MEITAMPNRRYRSGVNLEREIRNILEKRYNIPCLRTAGSKSDFDLVALGRRTILIQVKYTARKNLEPTRTLLQKMEKYVSNERWAVIVVVQRQTRKTFLGWMKHESLNNEFQYLRKIDRFTESMLTLKQLCSGYEIDHP
jgi:Holliday junction resolvase